MGHFTFYFEDHLSLLIEYFKSKRLLYYIESDGEFKRNIKLKTGFIRQPLVLKNEDKIVVMTTVMNNDYVTPLKKLYSKVFYVPLCAPSQLEIISHPDKTEFLGHMGLHCVSMKSLLPYSKHLGGFSSPSKKWIPDITTLINEIGKYHYLLPSGFMMKHDEFRVTQKIWESNVVRTSYIQYADTLDTVLDFMPEYPVELIYTPKTHTEEFIALLRERFVEIPSSIKNHFSFNNLLSILKKNLGNIIL